MGTAIITHRGLNPSNRSFLWHESTYEAFRDLLERGYGVEFDIQPARDGGLFVSHETSLECLSHGTDSRRLCDLAFADITSMSYGAGRLCSLEELCELLGHYQGRLHALHLKGKFQQGKVLTQLVEVLSRYDHLSRQLIIFDLIVATAEFLKRTLPRFSLAPSVAHTYDIERYNGVVGGTLLSLNQALNHRELFNWVWLDEWDRQAPGGGEKKLYTKEIFEELRAYGVNIALVTPELHVSSPGLLGQECHSDAVTQESLFERIREIVALAPDAVCTDYPDEVRERVGC